MTTGSKSQDHVWSDFSAPGGMPQGLSILDTEWKSPYNTKPAYEKYPDSGYTSLVIPFGRLENESTYRWCIRSKNSAGWSDWSTYRYFTVNAGSLPLKPVPNSPGASTAPQLSSTPEASTGSDYAVTITTPTMSWSGSGADNYEIAISKSPYGPSRVFYVHGGVSGSATSFTIPDGILQNGVHYAWDIQAINAAGKSGRSNSLYFTVQSPGTSEVSITSSSINPSVATTGVAYVSQGGLAATGGIAPYYWSVAGLPGGMQMYTNSGALFGTPRASGTFNPVVTVRDSSIPKRVASQSMTLTVSPSGPVILNLSPSSMPSDRLRRSSPSMGQDLSPHPLPASTAPAGRLLT